MRNFTITTLDWTNEYLPQTHESNYSTLIVSGCSFTDSTATKDMPVSWPGYVKERCRLNRVLNLGASACGNEYIATSIVNQIESMSDSELKDSIVLIVWSGIDRQENLIYNQKIPTYPYIDDVQFVRANKWSIDQVDPDIAHSEALRSWKNIMLTHHYLKSKGVAFGFSFYINVFDPPFLPRRDKTIELPGVLAPEKIQQLRGCQWINDHNDSLFEWCFYNDHNDSYFEPDLFHPSPCGYLAWTDNVLIPNLVKMELVKSI